MDGKRMCEIIEQNVMELCKVAGMTLHEVSEQVGVADSYFKRTHSDMPVTKVSKLASIFNVEPQKLWDEGFTYEIRKQALDAEIERLKRAREAMDFMPTPESKK